MIAIATLDDAKRAWRTEVHNSVFSATLDGGHCHPKVKTHEHHHVYIYPFKDGSGYLWLLWLGDLSIREIDASIKGFGTSDADLREAVTEAIDALFAFFRGEQP